jgi:hypothetical protein
MVGTIAFLSFVIIFMAIIPATQCAEFLRETAPLQDLRYSAANQKARIYG